MLLQHNIGLQQLKVFLRNFIPTAISIILFSSMIGALVGPNVATFTKNFIIK